MTHLRKIFFYPLEPLLRKGFSPADTGKLRHFSLPDTPPKQRTDPSGFQPLNTNTPRRLATLNLSPSVNDWYSICANLNFCFTLLQTQQRINDHFCLWHCRIINAHFE